MKELTPAEEIALIRKKLGHQTEEHPVRFWLNTGSPLLNRVFGSGTKGIAYGKMIELSGMESDGKTTLALRLAAKAQRDGAKVLWVDWENSWDSEWARKQKLDPENVYLFQPQIGYFGGDKEQRMETAEEVWDEVEKLMQRQQKKNPDGRFFVVNDSIAAMPPESMLEKDISDQNMRTRVSLAALMSELLRRWVAKAGAYNAAILFINQLRVAPGVVYGDPWYTPGGNAPRFFCAVRIRMRRTKGGKVLKAGNLVGVQGTLTNKKNKAGEGSEEGAKTGFRLKFDGGWEFVPAETIQKGE